LVVDGTQPVSFLPEDVGSLDSLADRCVCRKTDPKQMSGMSQDSYLKATRKGPRAIMRIRQPQPCLEIVLNQLTRVSIDRGAEGSAYVLKKIQKAPDSVVYTRHMKSVGRKHRRIQAK
jgi:hypothetical protein